jgi:hypothetical protein
VVWFRVDDRFHGSEPVKRIPREQRAAAVGLWTLAGTWSSQFLKDGFVPGHMVEDFGGSVQLAQLLVDVGLWRVKRDGFVFADWEKWQPTREHIESKRDAAAKRAADYRARKAGKTGESNGTVTRDDSVSHAPVRASRPDPTRPDHRETVVSLDVPAEAVAPVSASFAEFYMAYPRKVGKEAARKAFEKAAKKTPASVIVAGAQRLAADPNLPVEVQFIPHPSTWLGRGGWDDEPLPTRSGSPVARPAGLEDWQLR